MSFVICDVPRTKLKQGDCRQFFGSSPVPTSKQASDLDFISSSPENSSWLVHMPAIIGGL